MKSVGLKFLLTGGQWFAAVMAEKDALELIDRWQRGADGAVFGGPKDKWAIKANQIVGMHLIDLDTAQQQTPQQVPTYNPYGYNPSRS